MDGVIPIDKPAGLSSHDVVAAVRRSLGGVRTGHAGTLDPFATGLLLILVGRATKAQRELMELPKRYETVARLGALSSTGDTEGEVTETGRIPPSGPSCRAARSASARRPIPPSRSAASAHTSVRGGARASRCPSGSSRCTASASCGASSVDGEIHAGYVIECGSGTYVRSLIADLGDAYCLQLRRTAIGPFEVADAASLPPRGSTWQAPPLIELDAALAMAREHRGLAAPRTGPRPQ